MGCCYVLRRRDATGPSVYLFLHTSELERAGGDEMNRNATLLFVTAAVVSLGGCTGRIIIGPNPTPSTLVRANRALAAGEAEGMTDDGGIFRARGVRLSADSVFLGSGVIDGSRVLPRTRVVHIKTAKRRDKGALRGALFGAGFGVIYAAVAGCGENEFCEEGRPEQSWEGALESGLFGAITGAIIGAIIGSRTELLFVR